MGALGIQVSSTTDKCNNNEVGNKVRIYPDKASSDKALFEV